MKLLITGGHVTPAAAVIDELVKHKKITIIFVGRHDTRFEYQSLQSRNIRFVYLQSGRLTRLFSIKSLLNLFQFPIGLWQSISIVRKEKPDRILSFGGYIALPVAITAFLLRIPLFTHEQTMIPGLANRIIGGLAKKFFISFPQTARFFNKKKTVYTGNPVRTSVFTCAKKPFQLDKTKPVIYVSGGSLGSHSINRIIEKILPDLLKKYIVIHQTGDAVEYGDFARLSAARREGYFLKKHFYDDEIGYIYSLADCVVSRSGANTMFELIALQKPAVLIPLPWSAGGEQIAHARLLADRGCAEIVFQDEESASSKLLDNIGKIIREKSTYIKNFERLKNLYKSNAAQTIVSQIFSE